jgi:hypothetical protein
MSQVPPKNFVPKWVDSSLWIEPKKITTIWGEKIASKELLKVILPCLKVLRRRLNNNSPNINNMIKVLSLEY